MPNEINDGASVINLNEYADIATHLVGLFKKKLKLFMAIVLVLSMFLQNLKNSLEIKKTKANIFRIQSKNSIMCRYFCTGFIDFMLAGKI